jgi:hypothetical protein
MARTINTDVSLHRPGIEQTVKQFMKKVRTYYPSIIGTEMTTDLAFDRFKAISGFGDAAPINEGTDIPTMDFQTPFVRDFYVTAVGLGYEVTAQAARTSQVGAADIKKPTENMMRSIYAARELSAANLLTLGHTTPASGGTWTVDNVALFSASHPLNVGVDSNTAANALGITTLESAIQAVMQMKDYMGRVWVGPMRWKLVVPTSLALLAMRLVKAQKLPGSNDNDPNVAGTYLEVVVDPYLTDTNNWYLIPADDDYNPLFRMKRMGLQLVSHKLQRRPGDEFFGYHEEYGDGAEDYRGCFGNNPS